MRLYFALGGSPHDARALMQREPKNLLITFAYPDMLKHVTIAPERLIIDSGAFSAWNSGKSVSLTDFANYARAVTKRHPTALTVNLDVIPGEPGRASTQAERERCMTRSLEHADKLRRCGLDVIEVFHQDEPLDFLDLLIERADGHVIGLSPRNDQSVQARVKWLKHVLKHLLKTHAPHELPRFHGLAATGRLMLEAFPFYSADSISWKTGPMYGTFRDPRTRKSRSIKDVTGTSKPKLAQAWALNQSITYYLDLEAEITRLWQKRGVTWSN